MLEHLLARIMSGGLIIEPAFSARTVRREPPPPPYKKVSTFLNLPEFIPGLGALYVDPKSFWYGPFLAYDRRGRLVSTIYTVPIKDFDGHVMISELPAPGGRVNHVSFCFHAPHPGIEEPHYHIILWHIRKNHEKCVAT